MKILDTHTLLWFLFDNPSLSQKAKEIIENSEDVCVSIASLWEIAIKQSLGKLEIEQSATELADMCLEKEILIFPIAAAHLDVIKNLPEIHKDPFDRLIVATAISEGMEIITKDKQIEKYAVTAIW